MFDLSKVNIRHATINDVDAVTAIYNLAINEGISTFDEFHISHDRYLAYFDEERKKKSGLIVADLNNEVIGWTSFEPISERWAYRFTCLGSTYVKVEFRELGIGHLLKEKKFIVAKELGYHSIIGEVLSTNPKSLSFQLNLGYKVIGEIEEAGFRNDKWINLIVIQRFL